MAPKNYSLGSATQPVSRNTVIDALVKEVQGLKKGAVREYRPPVYMAEEVLKYGPNIAKDVGAKSITANPSSGTVTIKM